MHCFIMIHATKAKHIFVNVRQHLPRFFQKPLYTFDFFFSFHFLILTSSDCACRDLGRWDVSGTSH